MFNSNQMFITLVLTISIRHWQAESYHVHSAEHLTRTSAYLVLPVYLWFLLDDSLGKAQLETRAV